MNGIDGSPWKDRIVRNNCDVRIVRMFETLFRAPAAKRGFVLATLYYTIQTGKLHP